jgi:hypothetical protein
MDNGHKDVLALLGGKSADLARHIKGFLDHRRQITALWQRVSPSSLIARSIQPFSSAMPRQRRLPVGGSDDDDDDHAVIESMDQLYDAARQGRGELQELISSTVAEVGRGVPPLQ